jgi:hypothetical protein
MIINEARLYYYVHVCRHACTCSDLVAWNIKCVYETLGVYPKLCINKQSPWERSTPYVQYWKRLSHYKYTIRVLGWQGQTQYIHVCVTLYSHTNKDYRLFPCLNGHEMGWVWTTKTSILPKSISSRWKDVACVQIKKIWVSLPPHNYQRKICYWKLARLHEYTMYRLPRKKTERYFQITSS